MCRIVRRRIACRRVRRGGNGPSPDRVRSGSLRAVSLGAGHGVEKGCRVRYRSAWGMGVACRIASRRARRRGWASRAVSPLAGSCAVWPVAHSRLVTSRPTSATSRPCRAHGRASGTPVVGHVPAQQPPVADAATGDIRTSIRLYGRRALSWRVRRRG